MHRTGKIEDRVFGLADRLPPLPLVTRESREYDLLSVSVDGAEVAYAQQGRLALPPLVMLHGWAASHKFWKYCFSAFSPRWRVIAPDMVGFGISEKPDRDYTLEGLTSWLGKFLDALKLDRVTLVAHSMGGTIALLYALQNLGVDWMQKAAIGQHERDCRSAHLHPQMVQLRRFVIEFPDGLFHSLA